MTIEVLRYRPKPKSKPARRRNRATFQRLALDTFIILWATLFGATAGIIAAYSLGVI